jgi:hypothetical protein
MKTQNPFEKNVTFFFNDSMFSNWTIGPNHLWVEVIFDQLSMKKDIQKSF